jgi:DNA-directed RNA polymerase subunit RPC12/RpoP
MDRRGLPKRLAGADCASCGAAILEDGIAVLADRGDVAFVQLACRDCGSRTLSLVVKDAAGLRLDTARHPELDPATEARLAGAPTLAEADVAEMRRFLDGWQGDLRSLLGGGA